MTNQRKVSPRDKAHDGIERHRQEGLVQIAAFPQVIRHPDEPIQAGERQCGKTGNPQVMEQQLIGRHGGVGAKTGLAEDHAGPQKHGIGDGLQGVGNHVVQTSFHGPHGNMVASQGGGHRAQHYQDHQYVALGLQAEGDQVGHKQLYCPVGFYAGSKLVLKVIVTLIALAAVRHRTFNGQANLIRVFFRLSQQGRHGIVGALFRQLFLNSGVDVHVRVTGGLYRVDSQLVVAAPQLLAATQHLIVDVATGGEQHH